MFDDDAQSESYGKVYAFKALKLLADQEKDLDFIMEAMEAFCNGKKLDSFSHKCGNWMWKTHCPFCGKKKNES